MKEYGLEENNKCVSEELKNLTFKLIEEVKKKNQLIIDLFNKKETRESSL